MKHYVWVLIFSSSMLCALPAEAQQSGIIAGMNLSTVTGRVYANPIPGLAIGGFRQFSLARNLYLEPELLFSMQGGYCSAYNFGGDPYYPATALLRTYYFELPILIELHTFDSSFLPRGFDFFAGPDFEYLGFSNLKITQTLPWGTQVFSGTASHDFQSFELSAEIGGGPEISFGQTTVGIELKYSLGLTSISGYSNWFDSVWTVMADVSI